MRRNVTIKLRGGGEIRLRGVEKIDWRIHPETGELTSLDWSISRSAILHRNPMLHYVNLASVEAIIEEA